MNETIIINVPGSNNSKENNMNECYQIQSLILSNNQSLSSIFEFKTDTIHTLSVTLKAFDIIMLFCLIFMFLSFPFPHKKMIQTVLVHFVYHYVMKFVSDVYICLF